MILFTVNGRPVAADMVGDRTLLDFLCNDLDLKGTRFGCGLEQCGACTVLINNEPCYACTRALGDLNGAEVATVESLSQPQQHALVDAFIVEQAGQCGYCLSGILMSAKALLDRAPAPNRAEIAAALDRHLCRCGAHNRIIRAVERAALALREADPARSRA